MMSVVHSLKYGRHTGAGRYPVNIIVAHQRNTNDVTRSRLSACGHAQAGSEPSLVPTLPRGNAYTGPDVPTQERGNEN